MKRISGIPGKPGIATTLILVAAILLPLLLIHGNAAAADKTKAVEKAYQEVDSLFKAKSLETALSRVDYFRKEFPKSLRESSVTFIAAQAALELRQLERARAEAQTLTVKFRDSDYVDDAHWILAEVALMTENWDEARKELAKVAGFSADSNLVNAAKSAGEELDAYLTSQSGSVTTPSAGDSSAVVGVILPLGAADPREAEDFLSGFKIGLRLAGASPRLAIYDSEGDPVRGVRLAQQLAQTDGVWAIVGGLNPNEAAALSAAAELLQTPFLSTSCGETGLAAIGRCSFQGRAEYSRIGRELGKYAILDLELADFGILAPVSVEGRQVAAGFREAVEANGGTIITEESYYPGTNDFTTQLSHIRYAGLKYAYEDSLRDYYARNGSILRRGEPYKPSAKALQLLPPPEGVELEEGEEPIFTLSDSLLNKLWESDYPRVRGWVVRNEDDIDSLVMPITAYEGFLIVTEPTSIQIIPPQFARFNIQTQIFGDETWSDREQLGQVKSYIDGIIYAEPLSPTLGDEYHRFAGEIVKAGGGNINRRHLEGERAARMTAAALPRADGAQTMRLALSQIRDLPTLSGVVSLLKEERVDRKVNLMRYLGGNFEPMTRKANQMLGDD